MSPPIDIFAPGWSAVVRGEGGTLDSIFAYAGLRRRLGDAMGVLTGSPPEGRHVQICPAGQSAAAGLTFGEDLLAFASRPDPLSGGERRGVFCPPRLHAGEGDRSRIAEVYSAVSAATDALYLPEHPRDLEEIATVGPSTLFSPRSPELHARAVGSASWLVTYRPLPALAALGAGIPTLWIASTEPDRRLAASWGIKAWTPEEATASRVREWTLAAAAQTVNVPKDRADEWSRLEALAAETAAAPADAPCFASITSGDYLPFLEGQIANLIDTHPGVRLCVYVLSLDAYVEAPLKKRFSSLCDLKILQLSDLWNDTEMQEIRRRSVGVRAFSTKPRLIRRALLETGRPVFYADSDVHFFESTTELIREFSSSGALLFPHWNDDFLCSRKDGIFNAGMVVAYPRAIPFFDWWANRCWENSNFNQGDGVVADQGYLDFGPALFESVHPYRRGDHDVARWNLLSLSAHWDESFPSRPHVAGGVPVKTYHAAFVDSAGLSEVKFAWDTTNYFFSPNYVRNATPAPLMELTLKQQAKHWLTLSRWLKVLEKTGLRAGRTPEWLRRAVGPWGRKALGWLSRSRDVAWSSAAPTLPATTDPWILSHRDFFAKKSLPPELRLKQRA